MRVSSKLLWSFIITAFFFAVSFLFLHPIYFSGDDVYLLYLLGGGFGSPPTELLHYNHLMHPLIGWPVKTLFSAMPMINWYTVFLYTAHFFSLVYILYLLLKRISFFRAVLVYSVFFLVFETFFLLHVTFTVTAVVAGIAGLAGLIVKTDEGAGWRGLLVPAVFILIAALFRIHLLMPLLVLSVPFVIALPGIRRKLMYSGAVAVLVVAIALLNFSHKSYYKSRIPQWEKDEAYRQVVFEYFNSPIYYGKDPVSSYETRRQWLEYGIFFDRQYLSPAAIRAIGKKTHFNRIVLSAPMVNSFYWLYIESRVFLLSLLIIVALTCVSTGFGYRLAVLACAAGALAIILVLIVFLKLPPYMVPSLFGAAFVFSVLGIRMDTLFEPRVKAFNWILLPALCAAWGCVRAVKIDATNLEYNESFRRTHIEVSSHPSNLFVVTEDFFPIDYLSVWDAPAKFPLPNVLFKDHFFNHTDGPILRRFGLTRVDEIWTSPVVLFWGRQSGALTKYMREVKNQDIKFSRPLQAFKDADVRKILR